MPADAYAISKWEAEKILWEISARTGLEVVIIRAPLIYGPGVKGNFLNLLNLIAKKIPLPLLNIYNLRSFVGIDNLFERKAVGSVIVNQASSQFFEPAMPLTALLGIQASMPF